MRIDNHLYSLRCICDRTRRHTSAAVLASRPVRNRQDLQLRVSSPPHATRPPAGLTRLLFLGQPRLCQDLLCNDLGVENRCHDPQHRDPCSDNTVPVDAVLLSSLCQSGADEEVQEGVWDHPDHEPPAVGQKWHVCQRNQVAIHPVRHRNETKQQLDFCRLAPVAAHVLQERLPDLRRLVARLEQDGLNLFFEQIAPDKKGDR